MPAAATPIPHPNTRDPRWQSVACRDVGADGTFWFGVSSTGIFCRPGCPARTPKPEHVRFFDSIAAAKRAGFRACRRCNPEGVSNAEANRVLVEAACTRIRDDAREPTLAQLATAAGMSAFHFQRVFKGVVGLTPKQYAKAERGQRLRDALGRGASVTRAQQDAGYGSASRLQADAREHLGMRASRFRAQGVGECIRHAAGTSSIGLVLIAATDSGICHIALGDDLDALIEELQSRFPRARHLGSDDALATQLTRVIDHIDHIDRAEPHSHDLPLDIRGTAFQQRVWTALRAIPRGDTVSYAELAEGIGAPSASRAVASACAANTLAVLVPCHRVVRSDGGLSGYRWGPERKRKLLDAEASARARNSAVGKKSR